MGRRPLALRRPGAVAAAVIFATVLLDQVTKALVRARMEPQTSVALLGRWLRLTYVRNTGAAFGMLPGYGVTFMAVSVFVLLAIGIYWWRYRPQHPLVVIALSLVASGALGNLIDRFSLGRVTDFIEVPFIPVFNVADSAIVVGVSLLVWWLLFGPPELHAHELASERMRAGDEGHDEPDAGAIGEDSGLSEPPE